MANPKAPSRPGKGRRGRWQYGRRLLGWLVHAPLLLSGADKALRVQTLEAMNDHARWLDRNVARARIRWRRWRAGARLSRPAAAARWPPAPPVWRGGADRALGELLGDDGG
jgi:uncharacterized heparinase superfamily protein